MKKIEILTLKLENQIDKCFDTFLDIWEIEAKEWPNKHLSDATRTKLGMMFHWTLMRSLWDKFEDDKLSIEQKEILVKEIWGVTYEHYKELYWYDSKLIAKNS